MFRPEYGKEITTKSYFAGELSATKYEYEQTVLSDVNSILKDIIEAIGMLNKGETTKMTLELRVDERKVYHIKKRWSA
jgi:hypothetical protein